MAVEKYQRPGGPYNAPRPTKEQKPLLDMQLYPPPKAQTKTAEPSLYAPAYNPSPYFPPQMNPFYPYYQQGMGTYPIVKEYNINIGGPNADHPQAYQVIEGYLPKKFTAHTSMSLSERIELCKLLRSVFIRHYDGEDIGLDGNHEHSLINIVKFLELNPCGYPKSLENPYKGLARGFLLYRSCYPVRYDKGTCTVQCAPNAVGMNIRIYKMTIGEYMVRKHESSSYRNYDLWREIAYYEYIREQILKPKVCPNFALMYAYYVCEKCNIDFDKLDVMNGCRVLAKAMQGEVDLNAYSGKALIALTEAPNYTILGWATKEFKRDGNIKKMINHGYHSSEVWMSIIFQLMVALLVMQNHRIVMWDFSLQDNVYIKDLATHDNIRKYWKYTVDGVDYYVPNFGYLLMIDSNYKDVGPPSTTLYRKTKTKGPHKMYYNLFGQYNDIDLYNNCSYIFTKVINRNAFTKSFENYGGIKPPEDVLALLDKINNDVHASDTGVRISDLLERYMCRYVHNRAGTPLSRIENEYVLREDYTPFYKGQLVANEIGYETYEFCIYLEDNSEQPGECTVFKRNRHHGEIIKGSIPKLNMFNFSKYEPILQKFKPDEASLNEDELIETYRIETRP